MITKTTMVVIFDFQNSHVDFVLIDRRSLSGKRPKSASGKSFDIVFFHACCYGFSQGRKSLYNTVVYVIKDNVKE